MASGKIDLKGLIIRVDDRLIHGQVLHGWGKGWPADEIWLVSDRVNSDEFEKKLYEDAIPEVYKGGVLNVQDAISRWSPAPNVKANTLVVVDSCMTLLDLINGNIHPNEIQIGGIRKSEKEIIEAGEIKKLSDDVQLCKCDLEILQQIWDKELNPVYRPLPSAEAQLIAL